MYVKCISAIVNARVSVSLNFFDLSPYHTINNLYFNNFIPDNVIKNIILFYESSTPDNIIITRFESYGIFLSQTSILIGERNEC